MANHNIEQLYRDVIMDNYKNPHNKGLLGKEGYKKIHLNNPSCGDDMNVEVMIEGNVIKDIRHDGHGCSICCSSASVASELLKGKTLDEANEIINGFYDMIQANKIDDEMEDKLGEAIAYTGVAQFPARIKCATLSWKAIEKALSKDGD